MRRGEGRSQRGNKKRRRANNARRGEECGPSGCTAQSSARAEHSRMLGYRGPSSSSTLALGAHTSSSSASMAPLTTRQIHVEIYCFPDCYVTVRPVFRFFRMGLCVYNACRARLIFLLLFFGPLERVSPEDCGGSGIGMKYLFRLLWLGFWSREVSYNATVERSIAEKIYTT